MMYRVARAAMMAACVTLVACSDPPYVHDAAEFDRDHEQFGKDRTDISTVTVCYNKRGATPADVTNLAAEACGEFGKSAVFKEQSYEHCPLSHPVAATFTCVAASTYSYPVLPQF
ncbi:MAG: hypothetical protein RIC16_02505 [Rhodospirillales bacterium]